MVSKKTKNLKIIIKRQNISKKPTFLELYEYIKTNNSYEISKKFFDNLLCESDEKKEQILDNAFIFSIKNQDIETAKSLLNIGANINVNYNYIIEFSCKYLDLNIVKFLLDNGADITCNNFITLKGACISGNYDVVEYIIKNFLNLIDNNVKSEILKIAAKYDSFKILKLIIENGIELKSIDNDIINYLLTTAYYKHNHFNFFKYLVDNGAQINTIYENRFPNMVFVGDYENIKKYVEEKKINVNCQNGEALILAVYNNNIEIVKYLLDHNANPNVQNGKPLKIACENGFYNIVELLISYDADIQIDNHKVIEIAKKSENKNSNIIELLNFSLNRKKRKLCHLFESLGNKSVDTPPTHKMKKVIK